MEAETESSEILEHLRYVASQERKINLLTNFRGVPINLCSQVVRIAWASGEVKLFIHHRQILSLQNSTQILIQSSIFPRTVIAEVKGVDIHSHMIRLGGLAYVNGSMGQRKNVRVQPESPFHIEMQFKNGYTINGQVIDISLDGLSVNFDPSRLPSPDAFDSNPEMQVTLGIPLSAENEILDIQMPAKVAYLNLGNDESCCRLGLLTDPAEADQPELRRYIFDRQTEILGEIQKMNEGMLEGVGE